MKPPFSAIDSLITHARKILLITPGQHVGGGVMSVLALQAALQGPEKELLAVSSEQIPRTLQRLIDGQPLQTDLTQEGDFVLTLSTLRAQVDHIRYIVKDDHVDILITPKEGQFTPEDLQYRAAPGQLDLIITIGCASVTQLGEVFLQHPEVFATTPILNIDTSPSNEYYGQVNWVVPEAGSVCELITQYLYKKQALTPAIATDLLTGLLLDTVSFTAEETRLGSFQVAEVLLEAKADHRSIVNELFLTKPMSSMKLWGKACENLQLDPHYGIAWTSVSEGELRSISATPEDMDIFGDAILRYIEDSDVGVLSFRYDGLTTVHIRPLRAQYPLAELFPSPDWQATPERYGLSLTSTAPLAIMEEQVLRVLQTHQAGARSLPVEAPLESLRTTPHVPRTGASRHAVEPHHTGNSTPQKPTAVPFIAPQQGE
ncbi:hypothetical protein H6771_01100 [Candidatus Peribacteria bacterium]|nr:hypothetical protein [Candidatus Peribacteria bacterium]